MRARAKDRRPPRTSLVTRTALPGWAPRAALLAVVGLAGVAAGAEDVAQWGVVGGLALLVAARPHAAFTALAVVVLAGIMALAGGAAWWQLPVLLLATHLLLVLGAVGDAVPWRSRVEFGVLRDALSAFLVVQAAAQAAGVLAAVLQGAAPVPWLIVAALAGLGLLTWLLVGQLARRTLPASQAAALERRRRRHPF